MSVIVEVKDVTKTFGKDTAVSNVSFTFEENKIYGLLGRNGAGKTTIMHMLTGQQFESSGTIRVFGEAPYENNRVLEQVCFVKESQKYPDNYRVQDVLSMSELFFKHWDATYAASLVEDFRLPLKRRMKKLSRGMLSAVGIIVGLASRSPLTIFDEPYLGLDAVARSLFYNRLLEDYAEHPRTIVLSTHLIDEVSQLLEHVIVIDQGKILLNEDSEELRGRAFSVAGTAAQVEDFIVGRQVIHRDSFGGLLTATVMAAADPRADRAKAEAVGLTVAVVSLQQLIVHLTNTSANKGGERL